MPAGSSPKRERQYKHIKASAQQRGESEGRAEEIAARTVNKKRARHGEKEQLYQEAKRKNVSGRSKMTKAELERAVGR
jgi:hypothetical protein